MGEDELLGNCEISFDGHKLGRVMEEKVVHVETMQGENLIFNHTFAFETPNQNIWFNLMRAFGEIDRVSKNEVNDYFEDNGMYN